LLPVLKTTGTFYQELCTNDPSIKSNESCFLDTVKNLLAGDADITRPGMLYGKVQSGKTRTYIGIVALAFDNSYETVIVLTKNSLALEKQTRKRFGKEFESQIRKDNLDVYDSRQIPAKKLKEFELKKKLIFVIKKEKRNIVKILKFFSENPVLEVRKTLIIDDEADFASIGYEKKTGQLIDTSIGFNVSRKEFLRLKVIAGLINDLRVKLGMNYSFLQVTATPYALYLQPEAIEIDGSIYEPVKPSFTVLVPVHEKYIGGQFYFEECSNKDSIAANLYIDVPQKEIDVLSKPDRRYLSNIITTENLKKFRFSIINFVVGAAIRRIQLLKKGHDQKKYCMLIHTETLKSRQNWQYELAELLIEKLQKMSKASDEMLVMRSWVRDSCKNLEMSINKRIGLKMPSLEEVIREVFMLVDGAIEAYKVNSDEEIDQLLDDQTGQLKLRLPLSIFIGGQILDRGLTIENLIGFLYGRNPKTMQSDTVLQHCRIYGARDMDDMAVTRFYTTRKLYEQLKRIHDIDAELWEAFEQNRFEKIVFIGKDPNNKIVPCAPGKIMMAKTITLKPGKAFLPYGFNTDAKTRIEKIIAQLDRMIYQENILHDLPKKLGPFFIDLPKAEEILKLIEKTFVFEEGFESPIEEHIDILKYLSTNSVDVNEQGKVWLIVRSDRNMGRIKLDGGFEDAPADGKEDLPLAKATAVNVPALIMLRQNGLERPDGRGWLGHPFWWPVIIVPQKTPTVIFAGKQWIKE
jgi:Z1 domain